MKHLKTYNQLNEGLRDKMIGKSEDVVIKNLFLGNSKYEAIKKSFKKDFIPAIKLVIDRGYVFNDDNFKGIFVEYITHLKDSKNVKYLLDNENIREFFSDEQIYILEKFYFGMHMGKEIDEEYLTDEFMEDVKLEEQKKDEVWIDAKVNDQLVFNYVDKDKLLVYRMDALKRLFLRLYKIDLGLNYIELLLAISFSKKFGKGIQHILKLNF